MADDDEVRSVVICAPLEWEHTSNSIQVEAACGHTVWIAPAGRRVLAAGGEARCAPCAVPLMQENPDVVPEIAPGVMQDIEQDRGGWERAKHEAFAKRMGIPFNG